MKVRQAILMIVCLYLFKGEQSRLESSEMRKPKKKIV